MIIDILVFGRIFNLMYSWFDNNIIDSILSFSRAFGNMMILIGAVIFFLLIIYITIKNLRKLPKFYEIEITDLFGNKIILDDVRTKFSTYDAAKHYSEFYENLYSSQYKFNVIGRNQRYNLGISNMSSLSHKN
ncbi:MAG: hypothetical protein ACE5SW_11785 [Nitrososphaeraceae archaeon]